MLASLTQDNWIGLPEGLPEGGRYFEVSHEDGRIVLTPLRLADTETSRDWAPELMKAAYAWLEQAEREFEAERDLSAGRCLWEAVRAALTAAGVNRGIPVDNETEMLDLVRRLDKEHGQNHTILAEFSVARTLKRNTEEIDNYDGGQWDSFEFETGRRAVKQLVDRLVEMVPAQA